MVADIVILSATERHSVSPINTFSYDKGQNVYHKG